MLLRRVLPNTEDEITKPPESGPRNSLFVPLHQPSLLSLNQSTHYQNMPICIECRYPVSSLYTTYSKADDHALGKGVRLTQCPRCKRFADKYVEHDFVVLFIDLVLIKPQVSFFLCVFSLLFLSYLLLEF